MPRKPTSPPPDLDLPPDDDPIFAAADPDAPPEPPEPLSPDESAERSAPAASAPPAASTSAGSAPSPPEILELGEEGGSYQIVRPLAQGGMAEVFLARRHGAAGFERVVAIKAIRTDRAKDDRFRRMFVQESHLAATLRHPSIAQVFDLRERDSTFYLVMEYVAGTTLRAALDLARKKATPFSAGFAAFAIAEIADALHYAHGVRTEDGKPLGIVHRDVTPHNIMLADTGNVKLLDFGVAYSLIDNREKTETGLIKGKWSYMSPEQAKGGEALDGRSDLFGLTIVLVELLTGRRPFDSTHETQVIQQILDASPVHVDAAIHGLPEGLQQLIRRGLAKERDARFQSGAELAKALRSYLLQAGIVFGPSDALAEYERLRGLPDYVAAETRVAVAPAPSAPASESAARPDAQSSMRPADPTNSEPAAPAGPSATEIKRREELAHRLRNPENPRRRLLVPAIVIGVVIGAGNLVVWALIHSNRSATPARVEVVKTEAQLRAEKEIEQKQVLPPTTAVELAPAPPAPAAPEPAPAGASAAVVQPPVGPAVATAAVAPAPVAAPRPGAKRVTQAASAPRPTPTPEAPPPAAPVRRRSLDSSTVTSFSTESGAPRPTVAANPVPATSMRGVLISAKLNLPADPIAPGPMPVTVTKDITDGGSVVIPKGSTIVCNAQGGSSGRLGGTCDSVQIGAKLYPLKGTILGADQRPGLPLQDPEGGGKGTKRIAGGAASNFAGRVVSQLAGSSLAGDAIREAAGAGKEVAEERIEAAPSAQRPPVPKGTAVFVYVESFGGTP